MTWFDTMDAEAARHRRPMDRDVPLYGERTTWGSNERTVYPCRICSGTEGLTLVTVDQLEVHAKGHEEGFAEWLREHGVTEAEWIARAGHQADGPETWVPEAIAEQEAHLARARAELGHVLTCSDTCTGVRPSGYPCRCVCHTA